MNFLHNIASISAGSHIQAIKYMHAIEYETLIKYFLKVLSIAEREGFVIKMELH